MNRTIKKLQLLLAITVCSSAINLVDAQIPSVTPVSTPTANPVPTPNGGDKQSPSPKNDEGGSGGNGNPEKTACITPVKKDEFIKQNCDDTSVIGAIVIYPSKDIGSPRFAPSTTQDPNTECLNSGNYVFVKFDNPTECRNIINNFKDSRG
ncbi:MAG: hypothetical protein QE271_01045 [Bacteriovoracaceae bacterium]|nr:hypothetical protein [Bacteriovoracaceae bacterium]